MKSDASKPTSCVECGAPLTQKAGAGRRRRYCTTACRRKAQRRRQMNRSQPAERQGPLGQAVALEVQRLARQLLDGEVRNEDLGTLLERAEAIRRELEIYTAAAVQDARHRGEKWEAVSQAAHVAPETARARWGPERVTRMIDRHANDKRVAPTRQASGRLAYPDGDEMRGSLWRAEESSDLQEGDSVGQLASALAQLHAESTMSIREVAGSTRLSPSFISRVLSGDRLPSWDLVCSLAVLFKSDPADLRVLFEAAHGIRAPLRQPAVGAIAQLHAALRGLYRAAHSPTAERIERLSQKTVSAAAARRTLAGSDVPEWDVLAALITTLGGRPADFKPLWEAVHYAFLMCDDPRLPDGTAHIADPGGGHR